MAHSQAPAPNASWARRYRPAGFFLLRAPLLPLERLAELSEGLTAGCVSVEARAAAVAADRRLVRDRLRRWIAEPTVREALFVASRALWESLPHWEQAPDSERGLKVERTLVRYLERMCSRATPFGLFAGVAVGRIGRDVRLELGRVEDARRRTRLDMDFLWRMALELQRLPEVRARLHFVPNSSLSQRGDRWRYVETLFVSETEGRTYNLVALERTPYIDRVMARAADGATLEELAASLVEMDSSVSLDEAREFVGTLADGQVLTSVDLPNATGDDPTRAVERLLAFSGLPAAGGFREALDELVRLDARGVGSAPDDYLRVQSRLEQMPVKPDPARLFQVDLHRPSAELELPESLVRELLGAVELLGRLRALPDELAEFRAEFERRYEGRWVPLVEALDVESGPGFPTRTESEDVIPLLRKLDFPPARQPRKVEHTALDARLLDRLAEALRTGATELELTPADVPEDLPDARLPDAFSVMASLLASDSDAVAAGRHRLVFQGVSGPPGTEMLGRFCDLDPRLLEATRKLAADEAALNPHALLAEIVHLPPGRIGNIIYRPLVREHEITYLGISGAPATQQLPVQDLEVAVRGGRFVLRSVRLGRMVLPRLTNAHNVDTPLNLPIYRFLYRLKQQDLGIFAAFSWGPLGEAPFLPRVVYRRVIVSLATWRLTKEELAPLRAKQGPELFAEAQALRRRRALPRWVLWRSFDNELPIDFDSAMSVEAAFFATKHEESVRLTELLEWPETAPARGPGGRYAHELVVPVVRADLPRPVAASDLAARSPTLRRSFMVGTEWLYLKLYLGTATADRVLAECLAPALEALKAQGGFDRWFFIRYGDPDWHVRLRLHGDPKVLLETTLPALTAALEPWAAMGLIFRVQVDTYERELERYGGDEGMPLAEELFCADSDAVLEILRAYPGEAGLEPRWMLTLAGMDRLLGDLRLSLEARHGVMKGVRDGFAAEFHAEADFLGQVGDRVRAQRERLESLLEPAASHPEELRPGLAILEQRSARLASWGQALGDKAAQGRLSAPVESLAGSYLHMFANRMSRANARAQELVLYEMLARLYKSQLARRPRQG